LRTALMHATVTASFTLEAFGCSSLLHLERGVYDARFEAYSNLLGYN